MCQHTFSTEVLPPPAPLPSSCPSPPFSRLFWRVAALQSYKEQHGYIAVGVSTYEGPVSVARAVPPPPVRRQGEDPSSPAAAGQCAQVASGSHYVGSVQTYMYTILTCHVIIAV